MQKNSKSFLFWTLGFTAILLAAFLFNVSFGILIITILAFGFLKPILTAVSSKKPLDTFVNETVENLEAVPEVIEHLEESVCDTFENAKEKVSNAWHHHHAEVEAIESELRQMVSVREF